MRLKPHRWTILAVTVWVLVLGLTTVLAPSPADAKDWDVGWMTYSPNHPNGCVPLPYDCYTIQVWPPGTVD